MSLVLPASLSPSKVSTFKDCALAFRYSAIDRLPEPPSVPATKGTLVHAALEKLFAAEPADRTIATALTSLAAAFDEMGDDREFVELDLDADAEAAFLDDAEKTGKVPSANFEQSRLGGVQFYSLLCERLFGARPTKIQLLYLSRPEAIINTPTEQSTRGLERKVGAIWNAIERACDSDDFRPKPSKLCDWCAFKDYCPAFGGDVDAARDLAGQLADERAARKAAHEAAREAARNEALPALDDGTLPVAPARPAAVAS
jgi:putative RecB family exonuclease